MKRLLILLVVLAGGLAATSFAVPNSAASVISNGTHTTISQNQLNSDVSDIAQSTDYYCFLSAEELVGTGGESGLPPVDGVAQSATDTADSAITSAFVGTYLDTEIGQQIVADLAAQRHLVPTTADLRTAHAALLSQITAVFQDVNGTQVCALTQLPSAAAVVASMPTAFIARTVAFDATVSLLEESFAGVQDSTAAFERYFTADTHEFDNVCFSVVGYSTLAEAQAAAAKVTSGTPFATVAAAVSGGGPAGCAILYGLTADLPAGSGLNTLPLNTVSKPLSEGGSYLLVEFTKRNATPFASARTEVMGAVQAAGSTKARTAISTDEALASVSIDPRYGTWSAKESHILTPVSPLVADTLDPAVNSQEVAAAAAPSGSAAVPATGQAG